MNSKIETITAREACAILREAGLSISPQSLYLALHENVFPFGFCIMRNDGSVVKCTIFKKDLMAWIEEKSS